MEDSINRNLMIEVFEQELKYQQTEVVHCGSNYKELEGIEKALKWCIDKLKSCPKMNKWIPVSKRLPEDGTWNIWQSKTGAISIERYKEDAYNHFYPSGRFFSLEDAVAWMPLPERYKAEEEEG